MFCIITGSNSDGLQERNSLKNGDAVLSQILQNINRNDNNDDDFGETTIDNDLERNVWSDAFFSIELFFIHLKIIKLYFIC